MINILSNLTSSISGNIDKALLCIKKPEKANTNPTVNQPISNVDFRESLVQNRDKFILSFFSVQEKAKRSGYHILQVKYNPTTLKFSASAESKMATGAGGGAANLQVQSLMPASTSLQVQILFDDENHQDAFMWDKMTNLSAGAVVSDVSGVVRNMNGEGYSVRHEMEAMIALITQSETRQVVFYWGDTAFAGVITEIEAKYTMFNPLGHPVRGMVTLNIHQGGNDADDKNDDLYWDKAFDDLFSGKDIQGKVTGAVGNILNLK